MRELERELVQQIMVADEGELWQIYGKVKNGKSLVATRMALKDLKRGQVVIANWRIKWEGFDETKKFWRRLFFKLGLKKSLRIFPPENFIFLDPTMDGRDLLGRIAHTTDAKLYLDEGHRYFDSYKRTDMNMETREVALLTAHFNRSITIISQRPTAIHVSLRGNVNRFFKCEKILKFPFSKWCVFRVTEIQEMTNEMPDEENPERSVIFLATKKLYGLYDYKSMRGDMPRSQPNYAKIFVRK